MAYLELPLALPGPRLLPSSSLPFPITLLWALLWALASLGLPWALPGPHLFPSCSLPFSLALLWAVASLGLPWALPAPRLFPGSSFPVALPFLGILVLLLLSLPEVSFCPLLRKSHMLRKSHASTQHTRANRHQGHTQAICACCFAQEPKLSSHHSRVLRFP